MDVLYLNISIEPFFSVYYIVGTNLFEHTRESECYLIKSLYILSLQILEWHRYYLQFRKFGISYLFIFTLLSSSVHFRPFFRLNREVIYLKPLKNNK